MTARHARATDAIALLLLCVVAAIPRLVNLEADPPIRVSASPITDEGWWAQNARQHALFGKWVMDDHNPGLYVTPVYSLALRGVYSVAGVGIWQTRLLSVLSGILTCLVLYVGLRAVLPWRRALPPALLLALSLFPVTLNRIAVTESLQALLATLTLAGVLWSARHPMFGAAGGIALVLAVLCKPNVVILAPIIAGYWIGELWRERHSDRPLRQQLRPILAFGVAALVATAIVVLLFVVQNWPGIQQQLEVSLANVYTVDRRLRDGGVLFFSLPGFGLRATLLICDSVVPLLGLVLLAWRRLTRTGVTPSDSAERLMWWLLGLGLLWQALQSYQPDRRFLLFAVPLAVLGWRGLVEEGARLVPGQSRAGLPAHLLGGLVVGMLAGLLTLGYLSRPLYDLARGIQLGAERGLSTATILMLTWHATVALALLGALLLWRWAPRRGFALRAWLWLPLWLALEPAQMFRDLVHPRYGLRDGARMLAAISRELPSGRRVVTGDIANSMALESDLFAFVIRNHPKVGARLNLDGWERFHPALLVSTSQGGRLSGYPGPEDLHGFIPVCSFTFYRRSDGTLIEATIWRTPEFPLAVECPSGARPGD